VVLVDPAKLFLARQLAQRFCSILSASNVVFIAEREWFEQLLLPERSESTVLPSNNTSKIEQLESLL